jgi:aspartate/tyrosine/aromatic aminotransferase
MSVFGFVENIPKDPIFHLNTLFSADERLDKLNLGVGAYKTEELTPYLLKSVSKADERLAQRHLNKEYLPMRGLKPFYEKAQQLVFGEHLDSIASRLASSQTVGGTGGLRVFGELLMRLGWTSIHVSTPTWANHGAIFEDVGLKVESYPYYNRQTHDIEFTQMLDYLNDLPARSAVLLHGCCHNPTGIDLSNDQWQQVINVMKEKQLLACVDLAYQGFGEGIKEDISSIDLMLKSGIELIIAQSFSKNFGLYGERVGALHILMNDENMVENMESQLQRLARVLYSNPPLHGARLVTEVLSDAELTQQWKEELSQMRERITLMRLELVDALEKACPSKDFSFMRNQKGMFSFSGLNKVHVTALKKDYGIYMPDSGRINIAGLCKEKIPYAVDAIVSVVTRNYEKV